MDRVQRLPGQLRSKFLYNADLPLPAAEVPFLAAHESYPGHHTEDSWKDVTLIQRGRLEFKVSLAVGIQPMIAEGIAQLGTELVVDRESHDLVAELTPVYDPEVGFRVAAGRRVLADISANLVLLQARGAGAMSSTSTRASGRSSRPSASRSRSGHSRRARSAARPTATRRASRSAVPSPATTRTGSSGC